MYVYAWLVDSNEFIGSHIEHPKVSFPIGFGMCKQSITYHELTDGWVEFLARWYNLAYSKPVSDEWKLLQSFFERVRREGPFTNVSQEETTALKVIEELSITKWLEFEKEPLTCHSFQHSNLSAAAHAVVKLGYVGLKIVGRQKNLITIRPKGEHRERILRLLGDEKPLIMEHNRWVAERLFLGWKYATKRSDLKKQRPQISRWGLLDSIEKQKDQAQVQILVDLCLSGLLKTEMIDLNFPLHLKKLGDRHDISHDFDLAVERYQEAWLAISSQAQFDEELAFTILNNLLSCEIKLPVDSPAILSFASRQGNHHQNITFDHSEKFERLLERISTNLVKKQSNDDSIRSLRRVVKIFKEYGKNDKPIHLPALFKLGEELEKAGNLNEAETILREAHNIAKEKCDKKQILIAKSGYHLGSLLSVTANKYQEGRSLLIESLSIAENPAVKDDLLCIKLLRRLAESYRDTGDLNRAVEAGRRAFQIAVTINSEKPLETNVEEQCRELFRQLLQANSLPTTSINKEITEAEKNARQQ
jgi:tetratricopeptide (TPR) repeat protein